MHIEKISSQSASAAKKTSAARSATKAVAAEAATEAAGRPFSITTREYDVLVKALGGQRTLLDKKRGVSSEIAEIYNRQNTKCFR